MLAVHKLINIISGKVES